MTTLRDEITALAEKCIERYQIEVPDLKTCMLTVLLPWAEAKLAEARAAMREACAQVADVCCPDIAPRIRALPDAKADAVWQKVKD